MSDFTPTGQLVIVMIAIAAHLVLLLGSLRWNALFLITTAYCILAPLSVAPQLPLMGFAKWGRVYLTVLTVLVGFLFIRAYRFRACSLAFLAFIAYYVSAGIWSEEPFDALMFKGLLGVAVVAGLMLAASIKDREDLFRSLRVLLPAATSFALLILSDLVMNPAALSHLGRLESFGMNPNRIGQTAVPLLILASFVALHDPIKKLRVIAFATTTILAIIILYSGSRGALGEALIGVFLVAFPLIRRPGLLITVAVIVLGTAELVSTFVELEGQATDRITEVNFDTREGIWAFAFGRFLDSPFYGNGWIYVMGAAGSTTTQNMHSIYMQVLVETGLLGMTFMVFTLLFIGFKGLAMYGAVRRSPRYLTLGFLALGLIAAILAHGVVEAGTLMGTTLNAVFLAFGIGLVDRIPSLIQEEDQADWYEAEYGAGEVAEGELEPEYDDEYGDQYGDQYGDEYGEGYDDERRAPYLI